MCAVYHPALPDIIVHVKAANLVQNIIHSNLNLHIIHPVSRKRSSGELSDMLIPDPDSILGVRIQHNWREKGNQSKWKGTVLDRVSMNPSLFMVKYDGFDCVYGIELFKDDRVSNLQVLTEKVGELVNLCVSLQ